MVSRSVEMVLVRIVLACGCLQWRRMWSMESCSIHSGHLEAW